MEHKKDTTTDEIFILRNTKDKKVTVSCISAQEIQSISCPRCKYIIECAKKRLRVKGQTDENTIIGICDHCHNKSIPQISCYKCEDIAKKIINSINNDRSDVPGQNLNTWLASVKKLLKTNINKERAEVNVECVVHPQLHSNNLPETTDIFDPGEGPQAQMGSKPTTFRANDYEYMSKPKPDTKIIYKTRSFESYLSRLQNTTVYKSATSESQKQYGFKLDSTISSSARDKIYMRKPVHQTLLDIDDNYLSDNIYAPESHTTSSGGVRDYNTIDKKNVAESDRRTLRNKQDSNYLSNRNFGTEPDTRTKTNTEEHDSSNWQHQKYLIMSDNDENQSQNKSLKENTRDIKKIQNMGGKKDFKSKVTKTVKVTLRNTSFLMSSLHPARSATSIQDFRKASLPMDVFKSTTDLYSGHKNEISSSKSHDYLERLVPSNVPRTITGKKIKNKDISVGYYTPNKKYPPVEALSSPMLHHSEILLGEDFSYQFPKDIVLKKGPKRLPTSTELIKDTQDMLNERDEEKKKKIDTKRIRKLLEKEIKNKARQEKRRLQEGKRKEQEERKRIEEKEKKKDEEQRRKFDEKKITEEVQNVIQTKVKLSKEENQKVGENKEQLKAERENAKEDARENSKSEKFYKKKSKADKEADKLKKQKEREIQLKLLKEEKQREKEEKELLKKEIKEQLNAEKYQKQKEKEEKKNKQNKRISAKPSKINEEEEMSKPKLKHEKAESSKIQIKQNQGVTKVEDIKQVYDESMVTDETSKRKKEAQLQKYARDEADRKEKEIETLGNVHGMVAKTDIKSEPVEKIIQDNKINKPPIINDLNIKQIKVRKPSYDDFIIKLVRLKQSEPREKVKQIPMIDIPLIAREHKNHKYTKTSKCLMCVDSEFELEVENVLFKIDKPKETADIIIGHKIFKNKPLFVNKEEKAVVVPSIFQTIFQLESPKIIKNEPDLVVEKPKLELPIISVPAKSQNLDEQEAPKGIIRYALSDRTFIEKGWTTLPTEKVVRKMNVYRMRPAHPEFDWFEHHKKKKLMLYDTGDKLADFEDIGRSRIYYKNGRLALDYYDAEETNAQQRFVVYSSGELDERGRSRPLTILATFDYLGNGIVFDHGGKIRLKYNQTEGVVLDRNIGPVSHWKWHTLNDPPVLQKVMMDTQMSHKDPEIVKMGGLLNDKSRPDNEEMLAIEFDNFIKEKSKKLTQTFKPFQIKMKALKINEHFSLKILDQATIYLIFREGTTNIKINIGMILDHKEIVDTDTAEVGDVSNNLERFPARTESLAGLQRSVAYAQRFEKARLERERRLRPSELCASADLLTAASSRPLRAPLKTGSSISTAGAGYCKCSRKPCTTNIYYDTRLI